MTDRATYWRRLVASWEKSGQSQAEFCRRRNLTYAAFGYWRRRLNDDHNGEPGSESDPRFLEVRMPEAATDWYEVVLTGGRMLRIPRTFDPGEVQRLIGAVESC